MIKILKTFGDIMSSLVLLSIIVLIPLEVFKCCEDHDNQRKSDVHYGIEHPVYYEITFIDGYKDTISVWTTPSHGDYIKMYNNGGAFTDGSIVLKYTPYRKYTRTDCISCNEINLYNVLRYRKLRNK